MAGDRGHEGRLVLPHATMNKPTKPGQGLPPPQMPGFVKSALAARTLTDAYRARPQYQQHEFLNWIAAAKLNDAKRVRMNQMLDELEQGSVFKGEPWTPPPPVTPPTTK